MRVRVSLSKDGVSSAVRSLEEAKAKLSMQKDELLDSLAFEGVELAKTVVHVRTGDLKESIHSDGEGNTRFVIADVVGHTPNGFKDHVGSRYAFIENDRGGDHAYMTFTGKTLHSEAKTRALEVINL